MAREGMQDVIADLRRLIDDQEDSPSWSIEQLEQELDRNRRDVHMLALEAVPRYTSGDTLYIDYRVPTASMLGRFERATSGTTAWRLYDSTGSLVSTAVYSINYQAGVLTFSADQEGAARYLDARMYDLYGAAARIWREKAGSLQDAYDFKDPSGSYSRSQWYDHCIDMAKSYELKSWGGVTTMEIIRDDFAPD